jgi:hypothetical protein
MTEAEIAEMEIEKQKNQAYLEANRIPKTVNTPLSEEQGAMVKQIIAGKDYAAIERELNELKAKQEKEGGKGQLDANLGGQLSRELGSSKDNSPEFENMNDLMQWAKINSPEQYKQLQTKFYSEIAGSLKQSWEVKDEFDKEGNSCIGRAIKNHNADLRRKRGVK